MSVPNNNMSIDLSEMEDNLEHYEPGSLLSRVMEQQVCHVYDAIMALGNGATLPALLGLRERLYAKLRSLVLMNDEPNFVKYIKFIEFYNMIVHPPENNEQAPSTNSTPLAQSEADSLASRVLAQQLDQVFDVIMSLGDGAPLPALLKLRERLLGKLWSLLLSDADPSFENYMKFIEFYNIIVQPPENIGAENIGPAAEHALSTDSESDDDDDVIILDEEDSYEEEAAVAVESSRPFILGGSHSTHEPFALEEEAENYRHEVFSDAYQSETDSDSDDGRFPNLNVNCI